MSARPDSFRHDSRIDSLRVPPQSVEAERAVLGGLMISPERLERVASTLAESDFYRRDHRLIYRAILDLANKNQPFDSVTLGEWFEANALAEQVGGSCYLIELASTTPSAANIRAYADIVREKSVFRRLIDAGTEMVNDGFDPSGKSPTEVLDAVIRDLMLIQQVQNNCEFTMKQATRLAWDDVQEAVEHKGKIRGVATGFSRLDRRFGGWHLGDLIFIGGRPSMGKTALMVNLALNAADAGHAVGMISGEQSSMQIGQRSLAIDARVVAEHMRSGDFADEDWGRLNAAMSRLAGSQVFIHDRSAPTLDEVGRVARRWKHEHGISVLFGDYLQRIRVPKAQSRNEEVAEVARGLKSLARDLNIAVVFLAQVKADVEQRPDKRPRIGDIANSDEATREADLIAFLYRDEVYNDDSPDAGLAELNIEKNRHGPTGQFVLKFFPESMFFGDTDQSVKPKTKRNAKPKAAAKSGKDAAARDAD